uniref:Uncharacterized protein n=1 Tax=Ananas comosus var. bracteatus TaxID=296719 RepID=A0A6V7Q3I3_ANACO|nr:unnamed protein product [Ananas comosus var. bracteatus]
MVVHGAHGIPLEVVGTMIEMADVAWYALEHRPGAHKAAAPEKASLLGEEVAAKEAGAEEAGEELARLRTENLRLRTQLADNLALLQGVYKAPSISKDCPADLYERLIAAVDNSSFLANLESLHRESTAGPKGKEPDSMDVPINVDDGKVSWWVWVTSEIAPKSLEEVSGIDDENYVIITEEDVVDGIANFIARCILENQKSKTLSPLDLQKADDGDDNRGGTTSGASCVGMTDGGCEVEISYDDGTGQLVEVAAEQLGI